MHRHLTALVVAALAATTLAAGPGPKNHVAHNPALPCATEKNMASVVPDTDPSVLSFRNESDQSVLVHWINYSGDRVLYARLDPGTGYDQGTWKGHPWVITDLDGDCLQTHRPRHYDSVATVD